MPEPPSRASAGVLVCLSEQQRCGERGREVYMTVYMASGTDLGSYGSSKRDTRAKSSGGVRGRLNLPGSCVCSDREK